jgi:hypothetical protein
MLLIAAEEAMRRLVLLFGFVLAAGCAPTYGTYTVGATVASPEFAYVGPGVYAVVGYDAPVFYHQNLYWRYYDGYWYRSPYLHRGWAYAPRPPRVIRGIDRPYAYMRYRSPQRRAYVDRRYYQRPVQRDYRRYDRPVQRDYRRYDRPVQRQVRPAPQQRRVQPARPAPQQSPRVIERDRDRD